MFDNVGILMMLYFVEYDIEELGFSEDGVIALHFDKVIKQTPNVFDKMGAEASQSGIEIDENLGLRGVKVSLFQ